MLVMSSTEEARAVAARDAALQGAMTYIDRKAPSSFHRVPFGSRRRMGKWKVFANGPA
jgi:hypothetical protein